MAGNPKGDGGNAVSVVLGDKVVVVGDSPNIYPTVYTDPVGRECNAYGFSGDSGLIKTKTAIPSYTPIDNGGDFHGGNYTMTAMNGLHFEAAGGGLSADIGGNIALSSWGGLVNITSTKLVSVQSHVVQLNVTNTLLITGPTLYVDTDETLFNKNVTFGNNVTVNGGLAVNGELYVSHLTIPHSIGFTAESDTQYGYIPLGATMTVAAAVGTITAASSTSDGGVPNRSEIIISNLVLAPTPTEMPFVVIPPHEHLYDTIAATTVHGPTDLFAAMKNVESDTPVPAEPNLIQGLKPSDFINKITKKIQKRATDFVKNIIGLS